MTTTETAPGTREKILDAALRLFGEKGFAETSLRAITAEAGVNLAAVNYHFGSKEILVGEVFARLIGPLNRERIELLDALEAKGPGKPVPLESVIEAFIGPPLRTFHRWGPQPMQFIARIYAESNEHIQRIFIEQLREVVERFTAALRRTLPDLSERDMIWRLMFAVGSMVHTMVAHDKLKVLRPDVAEPPGDPDVVVQAMGAFICAGMRAPVPSPAKRSGGRGKKNRKGS